MYWLNKSNKFYEFFYNDQVAIVPINKSNWGQVYLLVKHSSVWYSISYTVMKTIHRNVISISCWKGTSSCWKGISFWKRMFSDVERYCFMLKVTTSWWKSPPHVKSHHLMMKVTTLWWKSPPHIEVTTSC